MISRPNPGLPRRSNDWLNGLLLIAAIAGLPVLLLTIVKLLS